MTVNCLFVCRLGLTECVSMTVNCLFVCRLSLTECVFVGKLFICLSVVDGVCVYDGNLFVCRLGLMSGEGGGGGRGRVCL